ncbi:TSL-kinase interacting protein 1 [Striga asiatica]|uniref:TSL-kinase interacting protein 1 n=1 Tax=Striga asiatica TaxID=4170 RepID=A0A5A7R3W7_STRAF|nr:TSL-kinase interacting protein 1 [Striga asiatica]
MKKVRAQRQNLRSSLPKNLHLRPFQPPLPAISAPRYLYPESDSSPLLATASSSLNPSNRFRTQNSGFAVPPLLSPPEENGGSTSSTPPLQSGSSSSSDPEAHRDVFRHERMRFES